jgi:hypothetical protein
MEWFFDIGVVDSSGRLATVFEIKHTHPITEKKVEWMERHGIRWFEVSADWILNRCQSPFSIAGAMIRPWTETSCAGCGEDDQRMMTEERKLGRVWCCGCIEEKSVCRHVDCVDFRTDNSEWCAIHARLLD